MIQLSEPHNALTLAFDDKGLESAFLDSYFEKSLGFGRVCHVAAVVLYGLFGWWDVQFVGPSRAVAWGWVFGSVLAMFALGLASSYVLRPLYKKYWQPLYAFYVLATSSGFAVLAALSDAQFYKLYVGVIFCLTFGYALIRLRFVWATAAGWLSMALYIASLVWFNQAAPAVISAELFMLLAINLLGMFTCYSMERFARSDFMLTRSLARAKEEANTLNDRLEKMVAQRTVQLTEANRELNRSLERERDLVRRLEADEVELRHRLESLRQAEEIAGLGYFERNWQTGESMWSNGFYRLLGLDPGEGSFTHEEFLEFVHPEDRGRFTRHTRATIAAYKPMDIEMRLLRRDGRVIRVQSYATHVYDDRGELLLSRGIHQDVTERREAEDERAKLESQLRQAQKLEAIGTLAGGVAHDFNNILAAIMGFTELTMTELPQGSPQAVHLKQAMDASLRARDLVRQILSFSRQSEHEKQPTDLVPLVKEALKMLRASLPSTIEIRQDLKVGQAVASVDPVQIHQVLMNLCTNAAQAMNREGGEMVVALERLEIEEAEEAEGLGPGGCLMLTVADTGPGMTREVREKAFEPFFTTKAPGQGTGMGLSVVHGIVASHGGRVTLDSEPGQGAVFRIYLPAAEDDARREAPEAEDEAPVGRERVLLVDDEPTLAEVGKKALGRLGYRVTSFTDSRLALDALADDPQAFDIVITDYTMPKLTGADLAREALALRPDLPIILATGFSEHFSAQQAAELGVRRFVMKPLVPREIASIMREVLDQPQGG